MAQILVRNLPLSVKEHLKRLAKKHGRSMEEEAREILSRAVHEKAKATVGLGTEIADMFRKLGPGEFPKIEELRGFPINPPSFDE